MTQRLSKISTELEIDSNDVYEIDNSNETHKKCKFLDELFYDIYFKYTDIKFYFECLDDDDKIKIYKMITTIIIIFICSIIFGICLYLN